MGVRRWVAAVVCVPLLGLAGCSDDDPRAEPNDLETTSASPSATPSGPSIPPEAQGTDEASAKAFVKFWFATVSRMDEGADLADLQRISHPACVSCQSLIQGIKESRSTGGTVLVTDWTVERAVKTASFTARQPDFVLRTRLYEVGKGAGATASSTSRLVAVHATLVRDADSWSLRVLEELK